MDTQHFLSHVHTLMMLPVIEGMQISIVHLHQLTWKVTNLLVSKLPVSWCNSTNVQLKSGKVYG